MLRLGAGWRRGAALLLLVLAALGPGTIGSAPDALAAERQARTPSQSVEAVGQVGGSAAVVAVRGGYAFVGQGSRLVVYDVSDPTRPRAVSRSASLGDQVKQITLAGDYAYVGVSEDLDKQGGGIHIFQIADPANIRKVGLFALPGLRAPDLTLVGSYGYTATGRSGLVRDLLDFSDPASPKVVAEGVLPQGPLAVAGQYAYLYSFRPPLLQVFDIADPSHPVQVGSMEEKSRVESLTIQGSSLYLLTDKHVLDVADLTDPANPRMVGQVGYERSAYDEIVFAGGRGYLTSRYHQLLAVADFADPIRPVILGTTKPGFGPPQMAAVAGDYAYVAAAHGGLRVFSVSDPTRPVEVGAAESPGQPTGTTGVAFADGLAYVADGSNGLHVVRVDDPASPSVVGVYRDGAEAWRVVVRGAYAYLLTRSTDANKPNLSVLDVSDPARPTLVGSLRLGNRAEDVVLAGSYAYVVSFGDLYVVDVSDPSQPRRVGTFAQPQDPSVDPGAPAGRSARVAVSGNYVYLPSVTWVSGGRGTTPAPLLAASGLRIMDVSNPAAPTEVSFTRMAWQPDATAIVGSALYVQARQIGTAGESGLRVLDVSDPARPVEAAAVATGAANFGGAIAVSGRYAYVAGFGMHILDTTDAARPVVVGSHPVTLNAVAADGGLAYAGDGSNGFQVLRFTGWTP